MGNLGFRVSHPRNDEGGHRAQLAVVTAKQGVLDFIDTPSSSTSRSNAGIVELFDSVFRDGDWQEYEDEMKKSSNGKSVVTGENKDHDTLESYFEDWKTFQFSDHKPMWVRISSDGAKDYLDSLT